jgi:hypothetical protein
MQSDIQHIEYVQDKEDFRFMIMPLGGNTAKNDRIRTLVPVFEQGRMYLPYNLVRESEGKSVDLVQRFLNDEYLTFPFCVHDDMLDCLARILEPDLNAMFPDFVSGYQERGFQQQVKPYDLLNFYSLSDINNYIPEDSSR